MISSALNSNIDVSPGTAVVVELGFVSDGAFIFSLQMPRSPPVDVRLRLSPAMPVSTSSGLNRRLQPENEAFEAIVL